MIRVMVAEDEHLIRGALVALLELEQSIEVVAQVAAGDEILPVALAVRPDIAVIDIDLPGLDGLSAARLLHEQLPECRTIILTSLAQPGSMRRALSAKVGGFLVKNAPAAELADAIRKVHSGLRVIDNELAMEAWDTRECPLTARLQSRPLELAIGNPEEQRQDRGDERRDDERQTNPQGRAPGEAAGWMYLDISRLGCARGQRGRRHALLSSYRFQAAPARVSGNTVSASWAAATDHSRTRAAVFQ